METDAVFVGVDVSKDWLDVSARPGLRHKRFKNDPKGIARATSFLVGLSTEIVAVDSTGGLENSIVASLGVAGVPVVVVNPRQVREFARATGKLAKTDAIDAEVLAHFAEAIKPEVRPLPTAEAQELKALLTRRYQVVEMLVAEKSRLARQRIRVVQRRLEQHIGFLERELDDLDRELKQMIEESPMWRAKDEILRSVPGIGPVASVTLLVRRQNKWDRMGAFKACNLDANRLRQFSDLPTSVRLDSFASPPVSSPVWRLGVRGTYPPA